MYSHFCNIWLSWFINAMGFKSVLKCILGEFTGFWSVPLYRTFQAPLCSPDVDALRFRAGFQSEMFSEKSLFGASC